MGEGVCVGEENEEIVFVGAGLSCCFSSEVPTTTPMTQRKFVIASAMIKCSVFI
jgi:hypothetical protein